MARLLYYEFHRSYNIKSSPNAYIFIFTSFSGCHCHIWPFDCRIYIKSHLRAWSWFVFPDDSGQNNQQQSRPGYTQNIDNRTDNEEEIFSENRPRTKHKKIFTQDDGEYVDFEEVK